MFERLTEAGISAHYIKKILPRIPAAGVVHIADLQPHLNCINWA